MKKKLFVLLMILVMVLPYVGVAAINTSYKNWAKELDDDGLLEFYTFIAQELRNRGKYPYVELKSGASGDEVTSIQKRLVELGYSNKDATGKFDKITIAAMKAFEKASNLVQDGVAAISDQQLLFSKNAVSKPTPTPKPTKKPTPTPKPTRTPDPRKAYNTFNFDNAARYPDENIGSKVKIIGTVVQVLGDRKDGFQMRVATRGRYDNIVYIVTLGNHSANILENDKITFYCTMAGDYTYESTMGASITLPLAVCDFH